MRHGRLRVPIPTPAVGHRRSSSYLRTIILFVLVMFIWLQLHISYMNECETTEEPLNVSSLVPKNLHKYLIPDPRPFNDTVNLSIPDIVADIAKANERQYIYNEDIFGPLQNDSLVIVIQVHERISYLRHLIVSLAQARHIESVLLVFSHDSFDIRINDLVRSIDFCKVVQIFYPYSIQTHPNSFPGPSPNDCPRNITKSEALKRKCINAEWPDMYGHYREARFTQTKHHWWWKANQVFSKLETTRHYTGLVLFLEEDHYVAEDFIHVLRLMQKTSLSSCPQCDVLSLGTYLKTYVYYSKSQRGLKALIRSEKLSASSFAPSWGFQIFPSLYRHYVKVEIMPWKSSRHNMGMAFNRTVWRRIRNCAKSFCTYDDYNWDWSLQNVSNSCMKKMLEVMMAKSSRVFHIGECGFHQKKGNCDDTYVVRRVQMILHTAKKYLFPKRLTISSSSPRKLSPKSGNGGWTDRRDHELCLYISSSSNISYSNRTRRPVDSSTFSPKGKRKSSSPRLI